MEIQKRFLRKYIHQIAIDQLEFQYRNDGYEVKKEEKIGNYRADLVAKKDKETIVIEVKAGRLNEERRKAIASIGDYVKNQGDYRFLIVVATEPKEKEIEIANLDQTLYEFMSEDIPENLRSLSSNTRLVEISGASISKLTINKNIISVVGTASLEVDLTYGSESEGISLTDAYPFNFQVFLQYNSFGNLVVVDASFEVDTSSYYS